MLILISACVIGFFSIILAYAQYLEKVEQEKNAEVEKAEANKYRQLAEQAREEIRVLQNENKELAHELFKTAAGYNSYPIAVITTSQSRAFKNPQYSEETIEFNIVEFHLINSGEYPLNNVKIQFSDPHSKLIGQYVTVGKNSIAQKTDNRYDISDPSREIVIGAMPKNDISRQVYVTTLPTNFPATYNIEIVWNTGEIEYQIDLKYKDEQQEIIYTQIYSNSIEFDKELIMNKVKDNFNQNSYVFPSK